MPDDFDYVITGQPSDEVVATGPITKEFALEMLQTWLLAEAKLATGLEYTIGNRTLRRVDGKYVTERINFWRAEYTRLALGRRPGARVFSVIPRDF